MDHKRGYGALDHTQESTRVKRHKDLCYQQPNNALSSSREGHQPQPNRLESEGTRRAGVQSTNLEHLRCYAENSARSVNHLNSCDPPKEAEKTIEDLTYEEYLPVVLSELSAQANSSDRNKWPLLLIDRRIERVCAICRAETRFKGWEALLIHAAKFQKENTHQHRGYYRALREALLRVTDDKFPLPDICQAPTSPKSTAAFRNRNHRWAPPVILMDGKKEAEEPINSPHQGNNGTTRRKTPPQHSRDPHLQEVLAVYGTGRQHQKKKVVVIPASEVGYINAELLDKSSASRSTQYPEDVARSKFMEGRWPGAQIKKYVRGGDDVETPQDKTSSRLCKTHSCRTLELGRPKSPKEKTLGVLAELEKEKKENDALRLWKPLEEHRHIFDEHQFDNKVQSLVSKWRNEFKGFHVAKSKDPSLQLENRFLVAKTPKKIVEREERFKDEVERYAFLNPSSRKQVRKQLTVLENQLRNDRLVWLQEVEAVREQFQALADSVHDEQVERDGATMRIEKHLDARTRNLAEKQQMKRAYYMRRKIMSMNNCKRLRRETGMQCLMDHWREEQRTFERECSNARVEKEKLVDLHEKIHSKARQSRRKQCPICLERWEYNRLPRDKLLHPE